MTSRLARLRRALRERELDALLVISLPNIRYLSGFTGSYGLCVVTAKKAILITDSRYRQQARQEAGGWIPRITQLPFDREVQETGALQGCRAVAFEAEAFSYALYRAFRKSLRGMRLVATSSLVEDLALTKEKQEIACIQKAAGITDRVFSDILPLIKPGVRERDIAAEISYRHLRYGGDGDAFSCIVASGPRSALPHARATGRRMKSGDLVILDFGCTVKGYGSDLTRTVAIGSVSRKARTIYEIVLQAQQAAIDAAKPGMPARELDKVARSIIAGAGFGAQFVHSLGHGLGLHVHERPRVSSMSRDILQVSSVFTIEPGIYLPGFGGVRIEDDVVLRSSGARVLNHAPKELLIL